VYSQLPGAAKRQPALSRGARYELPRSIPQLDRLRGLAILLVLLDHAGRIAPPALSSVLMQGWLGVDLFFVLSGFLITGILWDSRTSRNYFRGFYWRRVLRIWPAYSVLLLFAFCIVPLLRHFAGGIFLSIRPEPVGLWAFLLMIQNGFAAQLFLHSPFLGPTWSLAVEEQFYLIWPVVIRFSSRAVALPLLVAGFLLSPAIRVLAMHRGISPMEIYANPLTHGDGLLCGAMVALWLRSARPKRGTLLLAGGVLLAASLAYFMTHVPEAISFRYGSPFVFTNVALLSTSLLLIALVSENTGWLVHRFFFMSGWLSFLGFISYGLYLFHFFFTRAAVAPQVVAKFDRWHHPYVTQWGLELAAIAFSILLAWISRVTLERAALSKKGKFG
jgi:peptidoglycan/LPS O-acetylase OafA/YrhL